MTSPAVAPSATPASGPAEVALFGDHDVTPEDADIFRIFKPKEGPKPAAKPAPAHHKTAAVALPPSRPPMPAAVSSRETLTLAASSRADGR